MLRRPARELRAAADAGLRADLREVALDGARGDVERRADLLVRAAVGDEAQDVELARGELARGAAAALLGVAAQALDEVGGERGADDGLAAGGSEGGVGEVGGARGRRAEACVAGRDRGDEP